MGIRSAPSGPDVHQSLSISILITRAPSIVDVASTRPSPFEVVPQRFKPSRPLVVLRFDTIPTRS